MGQNGPDFIDVQNGHGSLYYRMKRQAADSMVTHTGALMSAGWSVPASGI
jgi:hypothetical protein